MIYYSPLFECKGRLPVRYGLFPYSSISSELNEIIQRCVEHGFLQFYDRLESFFIRLKHKPSDEDQQLQSQNITMENIWIYAYIFLWANCFNTVVFLCEIVFFHRVKIWRVLCDLFYTCYNAIVSCWRKVLTYSRALLRSIRTKMIRRKCQLQALFKKYHSVYCSLSAVTLPIGHSNHGPRYHAERIKHTNECHNQPPNNRSSNTIDPYVA